MNERGSSGIGGLIGLILFVILCSYIWNHWINRTDYSKPWWSGTGMQRVCKVPYYDNSECYQLNVESNGKQVGRVLFSNGGYLSPVSSSCYKAASGERTDRFCRYQDTKGVSWDILPLFNK